MFDGGHLTAMGMEDGLIDGLLFIFVGHPPVSHWNTQASEGSSQVNDLLNTGTSSQHLTAVSGNFDSRLFLGEPVQRGLVEEVEDPCDRSSSHQVVHQVHIDAMGKSDPVSQWWWSVVREDLLDGAIDRSRPVVLGNR